MNGLDCAHKKSRQSGGFLYIQANPKTSDP